MAAAVYVMVNGLGLNNALYFGAGAFYYADVPGLEKCFIKTFYYSLRLFIDFTDRENSENVR